MTASIDDEIDNLTQMELRRRRQSFIFLLFFFFLIRLWLQALLTGDSGLLPLCVILTIWFTRIQHQRRSEDEELQSQWQQVLGRQLQQQQQQSNEGEHPDTPGRSNNASVDLRLAMNHVPYQLQLAIAMLESQRMMEAVAANGNLPIRMDQGNNTRGVSEQVRAQWKHYKFGHGVNGLNGAMENESCVTKVMEPSTSTGLDAISEEKNRENQIGVAATSRESIQNQSIYSVFHRAFASRKRRRQHQSSTNTTDDSVPDDNLSRLESDVAFLSSKNTTRRNQYTSLLEDNHEIDNSYNDLHLSSEVPLSEEDESFENNVVTKPTTAIKFDEEGTLLQHHATTTVAEEGEFSCCSICLESYVKDDDLAELPCKHVFHDECISLWTSNNVKCPLCNFDLELGGRDLV